MTGKKLVRGHRVKSHNIPECDLPQVEGGNTTVRQAENRIFMYNYINTWAPFTQNRKIASSDVT